MSEKQPGQDQIEEILLENKEEILKINPKSKIILDRLFSYKYDRIYKIRDLAMLIILLDSNSVEPPWVIIKDQSELLSDIKFALGLAEIEVISSRYV